MAKRNENGNAAFECMVELMRLIPQMSQNQLAYLHGFADALRMHQDSQNDKESLQA